MYHYTLFASFSEGGDEFVARGALFFCFCASSGVEGASMTCLSVSFSRLGSLGRASILRWLTPPTCSSRPKSRDKKDRQWHNSDVPLLQQDQQTSTVAV